MKVHLKSVSFKKYSLILVYAFLFLAVIAWGMELYFEKLYGDLTRVGYFSERDFGWRSPQPEIPPELFKDYPLADADILVIGDSFSDGRLWQTRLVANDLKVSTIHWHDLNTSGMFNSLPTNLAGTIRASGFKGRYVIIESVERLFQERMKALCKERHPIVKNETVVNNAPYPERDRISLNNLNGAEWGKKALHNKINLSLHLSENYLESGIVKAVNFEGCGLFSNRLCSYAIFFQDDFKKPTFSSVTNVLNVNKNLQSEGIQAIWMIVPDKATVYLGYGALNQNPYENIWQQFARYPELIAPDLGAAFIRKSRTVKDFYMPNDSHLSTHGFLFLGDLMVNVIAI